MYFRVFNKLNKFFVYVSFIIKHVFFVYFRVIIINLLLHLAYINNFNLVDMTDVQLDKNVHQDLSQNLFTEELGN